ncbi:MAG: hypothetical protein AB8I08_10190 [Sandaracinaceae bacterium]
MTVTRETLRNRVTAASSRLRLLSWVVLALGLITATARLILAASDGRVLVELAATPLSLLLFLGGFVVLRALAPALDLLVAMSEAP